MKYCASFALDMVFIHQQHVYRLLAIRVAALIIAYWVQERFILFVGVIIPWKELDEELRAAEVEQKSGRKLWGNHAWRAQLRMCL